MCAAQTFRVNVFVLLSVNPTLTRVEGNVTSDVDVENADESVAFSLLIQHNHDP
jgi:hypothetical protein